MRDLSVIIPVYNTEKTLERCVDSVCLQDYVDMEIILVDDGSKDSCAELCDILSARDSRVRVIHKDNGGLSDARNAGLDMAQGEYVTFVDSDDLLLPETYSPLMKFLHKNEDVDILEFNIRCEYKRRNSMVLNNHIYSNSRDYWHETKAWQHAYSCNKIYKRKLFEKCRFSEGQLFEDLILLPNLLKYSKVIATYNQGTYVYTDNPQGLSRKVSIDSVFGLLKAESRSMFIMKTLPWNKNAGNLYYCISCRIYDLFRLMIGKLVGQSNKK